MTSRPFLLLLFGLWLALAMPAASEAAPPADPLVVDLSGEGLAPGRRGGTLTTLIGSTRDIRLMTVYGYARLVGYRPDLTIGPDLLKDLEMSPDRRIYTLHLRRGHRWSDGHPFTAEDFRYWWEDVANNRDLKPAGPPVSLRAGGALPQVEIIDPHTVRFSWESPNPKFLTLLAQTRPPFIYRPAHYMRRFHVDYAEPEALAAQIAEAKVKNWAQLHNRLDNLYKFDNPDLPTLQPWRPTTRPPAQRFVFERNPHYHRVDVNGVHLPYIDRVVMDVVDSRLIAARTQAGRVDLQSRGLGFSDIAVLKRGEGQGDYTTRLWQIGKGSVFALYPNLNANDPLWRGLMRDRRFRLALSLGIDRRIINQSLFLGLASEGNNTVLPQSPLFREPYLLDGAEYAPLEASRLLEAIGLTEKRGDGTRLLPDGRPLEIVIDISNENPQALDILSLIQETWAEIGVRLFVKISDRATLRNRVYSGAAVMAGWSGWDLALATPDMAPTELAPVQQVTLNWPKWGQYYETGGKAGQPVDLAKPSELLSLAKAWERSRTDEDRKAIWDRMLRIHTKELYVLGTVQSVAQPVVVSNRLRNVPENGIYAWEPGALIGIYRPDQFWFAGAGTQ
ncbi:MAG: ABC transporter substrate-binding protein [Alphaproteobacteria bacterium]